MALAAGLAVDLNTRSSLALHSLSGENRHIELINGEAMIMATAKDGERCLVTAGGGQIVARTARFSVREDGAFGVRVVCLEGSVEVQHQGQRLALSVNEQVVYGQDGLGRKAIVDAVAVTSWQQGRLEFRGTPLRDVIAEVNRYRPGLIVLMDSALGGRLIDANFKLDGLETVIVYLQQAFDVPIRQAPRQSRHRRIAKEPKVALPELAEP